VEEEEEEEEEGTGLSAIPC